MSHAATSVASGSSEKTRMWFMPQYPQPRTATRVGGALASDPRPLRPSVVAVMPLPGPEDSRHRPGENLEIAQDGPLPDVLQVEGERLRERELAASAHLPEARDARVRQESRT